MRVTTKIKTNRIIRQVLPVSYVIGKSSDALVDVSGALQEGVKCDRCGENHLRLQDGDDVKTRYVTVIGTLLANWGDPQVGNVEWDTKGVDHTHFCAKCFVEEAAQIAGLKIKFDGGNEE